jgi:polyhydroxybutyrate depolymerase
MRKIFLPLLFFITLISCDSKEESPLRSDSAETYVPIPGSGTFNFLHDRKERLYHYYQPLNLPENAPLVFLLHGYNGDAEEFMNWLSMEKLADENGFAFVFPQGYEDVWGTSHWNANLDISNVDDVGFLSELALHLQETYNLDPERTFTSGFSNGGFMSYELIIKKPDIFKAAASIAGTMSGETWANRNLAEPKPVLQLSGGRDRIVPINGAMSTNGGWGGAPEMTEIIDFWVGLNEANSQNHSQVGETKIYKYSNGNNNSEVWYYLIENMEHNFPLGNQYNVHTPSLIWEFFSKY